MKTREAIPLAPRPQRPRGSASLDGVARITRDEVRKVAALARLSLGDDAAQRMASELDQILEYVQTLSAGRYHGRRAHRACGSAADTAARGPRRCRRSIPSSPSRTPRSARAPRSWFRR